MSETLVLPGALRHDFLAFCAFCPNTVYARRVVTLHFKLISIGYIAVTYLIFFLFPPIRPAVTPAIGTPINTGRHNILSPPKLTLPNISSSSSNITDAQAPATRVILPCRFTVIIDPIKDMIIMTTTELLSAVLTVMAPRSVRTAVMNIIIRLTIKAAIENIKLFFNSLAHTDLSSVSFLRIETPPWIDSTIYYPRGCLITLLFSGLSTLDGNCPAGKFDPDSVGTGLDGDDIVLDVDDCTNDAADGGYLVTDLNAVAHLVELFLFLLLRTKEKEVENNNEDDERQ